MENLKSFLDGELDLAGKAEVEAHLRQDSELAKMSADFSAISGALQGVDAGEPYGLEKLQGRLREVPLAESKRIWRVASWSSVIGLVLVAVVAFPMFAQSKSASKSVYNSTEMMKGPDATASPAAPMASAPSAESEAAMPMSEAKKDVSSFRDGSGPIDDGVVNGSVGGGRAYGLRTDPDRGKGTWLKYGEAEDPTLQKAKSVLPADDKAKLNMSIGKNSPGAPYGVYLEKSGSLTVEVEDLMRAVDEATGMVTSLKGFVVTSDVQNTADGGSAHITLRVPTDNFPTAMNKLQAMGEVRVVNSASQDITGETVTTAAKTRSWADEEKRLVDELSKSRNRDEKWRIRESLNEVRANLEAEKAQLNNLKERGNFSTIEATFTRGASGGGWAKGAFGDAKSGLGSLGQILGTLGIYLLVFTPVWLPLAIAGWMVSRRRR